MRFLSLRPAIAIAVTTLVTFAPGCSSSAANGSSAPLAIANVTAPSVSGTRLRARFVEAGGARAFVGFHDLERQEDCTFQPIDGGVFRCIPEAAPFAFTGVGFADAACEIPLITPPAGCAAKAKYVRFTTFGSGECGSAGSALRKVIDPVSSRYVGQSGACVAQSSAGGPPALAPGEVVPWAAFVEAAAEVLPPAAGETVSERVLVATDGARQHLGYRIEGLSADCTFNITSDGLARCVPASVIGEVDYADEACSLPAFVQYYDDPCVDAPRFWVAQDPLGAACKVGSVYALGGSYRLSSDGYAQRASGQFTTTCQAVPSYGGSSGPNNRHALKGDITSGLPTRARVVPGSGRLVPALVARGTDTELELGWHDTERDVDCAFASAQDGKLRCLPLASGVTLLSTDDACTSPAKVAVLGETSCVPASSLYGRVTTATCPETTRVFALSGIPRAIQNASLEIGPGRCGKTPTVSNAYDATEVDPALFVEGVPITE